MPKSKRRRTVDFAALAARLRPAADPTRVHELLRLGDGERSAGELVAASGLSLSAMSYHLAALRVAGVVESRRDDKWVFYRLTEVGREMLRVIEALGA